MDKLPSMPAALTRAVYSGPTFADSPTMTCLLSPLPIFSSRSLIARVAASPSITGIIMSIRMQS